MSAPKSVTKMKIKNGKTEIELTSNVDAAQYYIYELTRAALRDVGKYVKKEFQARFQGVFRQHTGAGGRSTSYKVISGKSTTAPRVQVGLSAKTQKGFYGYFEEFGSSHTKKHGLLQETVDSSIAEIINLESQYLSGLSGEAAALAAQIDESEYSEEED